MNELKQKIEQSIFLLSMDLYDENNHLRGLEYFKSEEDRQNRVNLIIKYKQALNEINLGKKMVDVPLLKAKNCPKEVQELARRKANQLYNIEFSVGGSIITFNGVASQIQYPDGTYHDTIVLYKNYSPKYNKNFIVYIDKNKMCYSLLDGKIPMRDIANVTDEMKKDFYNQFVSQDPKKINLLSVPKIIRCLGVAQFEIVQSDNNKTNEIQSIQDDDGKYRYKLLSPNLIKYLISSIKKENPDLEIAGEVIEGEVPGNIKTSIIVMSKPFEQIKIPQFAIYSDHNPNEKKDSLSEIINRIEPIKYIDFIKEYNPKVKYGSSIVQKRIIRQFGQFVSDLKMSNPDDSIILNYDENMKSYQIMSTSMLYNLKPVVNPRRAESKYDAQFCFDKNGFLFIQNQKLVKYGFNEKNEFYEKRPYYYDKYLICREKVNNELPIKQEENIVKRHEPTDKEIIENLKEENARLKILFAQKQRECEEYELKRRQQS